MSRDEKEYVGDLAVLVAACRETVNESKSRNSSKIILQLAATYRLSCKKLGSVSSGISIDNARREGLLKSDGFQRCKIAYQEARMRVHAVPLYKKDVLTLIAGQLNGAGMGEDMLHSGRGSHLHTTNITDV